MDELPFKVFTSSIFITVRGRPGKKTRAKLKIGFLFASRQMQSGFCGAGSASASSNVRHEFVEFAFGEEFAFVA